MIDKIRNPNIAHRIKLGETNSNIKGSNGKNNLYITILAISFVWIILILVIRYCFVFRPILYDQACFGFKNSLFNKTEPIFFDLAQ